MGKIADALLLLCEDKIKVKGNLCHAGGKFVACDSPEARQAQAADILAKGKAVAQTAAAPAQAAQAAPTQEVADMDPEQFIGGWRSAKRRELEKLQAYVPEQKKFWSAPVDKDSAATISKNAKARVRAYAAHLPGEDVAAIHDLIDSQMGHLSKAMEEDDFHPDAQALNRVMGEAVDNLVYQTQESYKRQLGDHGVRHIHGNILMQEQAFDAIAEGGGPKVSAKDKFMAGMVQVNHDLGYTAKPAKVGLKYTGKHKEYSSKIFENESRSAYDKIFGRDGAEQMKHLIETHDTDEMDWEKDPVGSSVRMGDNLALYHKEKLPGLFRFVDGSLDVLEEIGEAAQGDPPDEKKVEASKKKLEEMVDASELSKHTKRALKSAIGEVSRFTPRFTLGMLGGEVEGMKYGAGAMDVTIKKNDFDTKLQEHFDMGQSQFKKFADSYGIKEVNGDSFEFKRDDRTVLRAKIH